MILKINIGYSQYAVEFVRGILKGRIFIDQCLHVEPDVK